MSINCGTDAQIEIKNRECVRRKAMKKKKLGASSVSVKQHGHRKKKKKKERKRSASNGSINMCTSTYNLQWP